MAEENGSMVLYGKRTGSLVTYIQNLNALDPTFDNLLGFSAQLRGKGFEPSCKLKKPYFLRLLLKARVSSSNRPP